MNKIGSLYLGIDGGGSKTEAVLCKFDDHSRPSVIKRKITRSAANWLGTSNAVELANQSISSLCSWANDVAKDSISAAVVGMAGLQIPGKRKSILETLNSHFPQSYTEVISDAEAAYWTGGADHNRITVVSGTGSIALTRFNDDWVSAGGHGIILADEGSGFWIGKSGLRAAVQYAEGRGRSTILLESALQFFSIEHVSELVPVVHPTWGLNVRAVASFAREVFRAARAGDNVARGIIQTAGTDLADLATSLLWCDTEKTIEYISIAGGIWNGQPSVLYPFAKRFWTNCFALPIAGCIYSAGVGAALAAKIRS